jgi:phosphoglycerate dehydrogenase-like enzyme
MSPLPEQAGARPPCVFVCRDHMLDILLDPLADQLASWGVQVIRGPKNRPGEVLHYSPAQFSSLFEPADLAVFSSRSRCTRELMQAAPRLRAVINPTIGVETVDLAAATELGILVGNGATPENHIGMAEASVMLMLNLMYGLRQTEEVMRLERPRPNPDAFHARMISGRTVGLLGLGNIGRAVATRLRPFGVKLLAYSPHAGSSSIPAGVDLVSFERLMSEADIVGVFIAVTPGNRHLVNESALRLMKRSAYLVNVARGDAIDEPALVRALQEGWIAGAALDTFAVEPLPSDSPLRGMNNVILTPHLVGHTKDAFDSLGVAAQENIIRVLHGELPLYCKNPQALAQWRQRLDRMDAPYRLPQALAAQGAPG